MKFYKTTSYQQTQKSQTLRLIDVFVLGPLMLFAAGKIPQENNLLKDSLTVAAALTIAYNGGNYLENRKGE